MEWNLLEKTTFWVEGAELEGANLDDVAKAAAHALRLDDGEVMVVDVQPGVVAFDVLRKNISAGMVAGKSEGLLKNLSCVAGVALSATASVHSEGVLGLIALDPDTARQVVSRSAKIGRTVAEAVQKRACVFATGTEVIAGKIEDTNSPYLVRELTQAGFQAEFSGIIEDNTSAGIAALESALMRGFGLVVTTGGVGAESKDHSIEAVLKLDPQAATPWILRFAPDMKRHPKEGVRIALGRVGISRILALPGPHAEVKAGCNALISGMKAGLNDTELSESIASAIRERWLKHMETGGSNHGE
ncbi:MAG: molybdopterin-binding protein [Desulfobaccales bacterium]